jgi:enamine deaminase RidA (YjgF/YER057c/UK114 family)
VRTLSVFGNPDLDPIPVGTLVDDLLHVTRISGRDPQTGVLGDDIRVQLRNAYANMKLAVENAGGTLDNVAHVSMYWANWTADREEMNPPWVEVFPDAADRPTYKFMPAPGLAQSERIAFECYAVMGARRELLAVDGVAHTNPIPLGVRIGRYVFSSRMLPYDPSTGKAADGVEAQANFLFANTAAMLARGRMGWKDVVYGRAFMADPPAQRPLVDEHWQRVFPDAANRPALNRVKYGGGPLQVMLEIIARQGI